MVVVSEVRKRYLLPAIKGRVLGRGGVYECWVFLMASKIAFGNMVWFSFRLFVCGTFSMDMESFEGVQMESFSMIMEYLHDTVHRSEGVSSLM